MRRVVIVGAGASGLACAYLCAKAGFETIVLERGAYPGSKNIMGGVCRAKILHRLLGGKARNLPLERRLTRRKVGLLDSGSELSVEHSLPDTELHSVLRAVFDHSFAKICEEEGAEILCSKLVVEASPSGVRCDDGSSYEADGVVLGEGMWSEIAWKLSLREKPPEEFIGLAVKDLFNLPQEKLEERFGIDSLEGYAADYIWLKLGGFRGRAFIYTNRDSVSVGVGLKLEEVRRGARPTDFLEAFEKLRALRKFLDGAEAVERTSRAFLWSQPPDFKPSGTGTLLLAGDAGHYALGEYISGEFDRAIYTGASCAEALAESVRLGSPEFSEIAYTGKLIREGLYRRIKPTALPEGLIPKTLLTALQRKLESPSTESIKLLLQEARKSGWIRILKELLEWVRIRQ